MSSDMPRGAVRVTNLGKHYAILPRPLRRLWHTLLGVPPDASEGFWPVRHINFSLQPGQALGIVGLNGAGKSTLLQLINGALTPTEGRVETAGRVAALLELGAGFNPEFTGRENIHLYAAALGFTRSQILARFEQIVTFSGLRDYIDRPVKTYSSGMLVRLAFSVASALEPDILIIDEALSVGDGDFSRKSFDRIAAIKEQGATIILCSHVLYHIDLFCDHVLWLHEGRVKALGPTAHVLSAYRDFLDQDVVTRDGLTHPDPRTAAPPKSAPAEITSVEVRLDGVSGERLAGRSGVSTLTVDVGYRTRTTLPPPHVAVVLSSVTGRILASHDSQSLAVRPIDGRGRGRLRFVLPSIPLTRGIYRVGVYLLCERARHVYQWIDPVATLELEQTTTHQGYFLLNGHWEVVSSAPDAMAK
ncbi:ABC transporter ATP-binding protein [Tepidimonas charontis]|uniref:Teichoic acids export ATP-binding protein TagH n=1 Tax=Tepidimonas charontis TaxID=2267262 RepID=A0A554XC93_9BURK|nr:ABC transporter ATP-binding protein [Tepidimonas charontis]TSE33467.1 Teichoic acids export ATP-binding protein TagH [Tepidimonas charontis]